MGVMGKGSRKKWLGALFGSLVLAGPAFSQDLRTPESWLNSSPNDRLPISERKLVFPDDTTAPRPPAPRRTGWTPRLSFAYEFQDRDAGDNNRVTLTPGLSFERAADRYFVQADLSFELTENFDDSDLSSGFANPQAEALVSYSVTERTRLSTFGSLSRLRDGTQESLAGFVGPDTEIETATIIGSLEHDFSQRADLKIDLGGSWQSSDQLNVVDVDTLDFDAVFGFRLDETTQVQAHAGYLNADFSDNPGAYAWEADLTLLRRAGPRLTYSATLGAQAADGVTSPEFLKYAAEINYTTANAIYSLNAGSDIFSVIGLTNLARTEQVTASGHWRLGPGWQLQASLRQIWLEELNQAKTDTTLSQADVALSYAWTGNNWVWIRAVLTDSETGGVSSNDERISIGITRTFN